MSDDNRNADETTIKGLLGDVLTVNPDGTLTAWTGPHFWTYRDWTAYEAWHMDGDDSGVVAQGLDYSHKQTEAGR